MQNLAQIISKDHLGISLGDALHKHVLQVALCMKLLNHFCYFFQFEQNNLLKSLNKI
jgi:hypothetical protein